MGAPDTMTTMGGDRAGLRVVAWGHALALVPLAACNASFGLRETELVDSAVPDAPDGDHDGIADESDNCPLVANASQHDEDRDLIGDACDNCPIVSNPAQSDVGDGDLIGDDCDPHPGTSGDCLILVDTFVDPSTFSSRWRFTADSPVTAQLTSEPDHLLVTPPSGEMIALQALDEAGNPFTGVFDVQLAGRLPKNASGWLGVAGALESRSRLFACELIGQDFMRMVWDATMAASGLSNISITDELLIRFDLDPYPSITKGNCRVDRGPAVGVMADMDLDSPPAVYGPAIVASSSPSRVDAIAVYDTVSPCPTPIRR